MTGLRAVVLVEANLLSKKLLELMLHHQLFVEGFVSSGQVSLRLWLDVADGTQLSERLLKALAVSKVRVEIYKLIETLLHRLNIQDLFLRGV